LMRSPEIAVRIVADLDALVPVAEEPEPEPDLLEVIPADSIRSLVRALQPSALHDLALEMGATCPEPPASGDVQPEPTVTITSSAVAMRTLSDEDLAALSEELAQRAIDKARELTS